MRILLCSAAFSLVALQACAQSTCGPQKSRTAPGVVACCRGTVRRVTIVAMMTLAQIVVRLLEDATVTTGRPSARFSAKRPRFERHPPDFGQLRRLQEHHGCEPRNGHDPDQLATMRNAPDPIC